jgi:hypothetical protein
MSRFHLHPACRLTCGRCGTDLDATRPIVTRDDPEICVDCDDLADELSAARPDPRLDPAVAAFCRAFGDTVTGELRA